MVDTRQEYESAKAMERQRKEEERGKRLESFKGQHVTPTSPSDFHHHGINALRAMIESANPEAIETSGTHWRASADRLAGEDGHGGIRKAFMAAVDHASAHWEGSASEAFRREAGKVLEKVDKTYRHARIVERTLIGTRESGSQAGVAHNLRKAKEAMSKIHDPGKLDSALDSSGDDSQFKQDMANPKMDARRALELNRDSLSLSKERQVEAVVVMDELAYNYQGNAAVLEEGTDQGGVSGDWPKEPSTRPAQPPVHMPVTGGTHPRPTAAGRGASNGGGGHAVPPGFDGPKISRPELPVHTGLDSLQGGTLAPPGDGGVGGGMQGGGNHAGGSGGGGGFSGGAVPPGVIGMPGVGATRGGGSGGMKGGAAGGGAAAAGRGGAQARPRGGTPGKPGGPAGGAKQGGAGLHRSRGGSQAGMAGGVGAKGARKDGKKRTGKQRPDYLVEDEETWASQRNVAPRVIE